MVNEFKNTQMKEALAKIKEKQTTEMINTMLAALMTTKFWHRQHGIKSQQ